MRGYFCTGFVYFTLGGKTLSDYTSFFNLMIFKKSDDIIFLVILKLNEQNFIKVTNMCSNLSDQTKFRLNEINKVKDYFISEIPEKKYRKSKKTK